MAAGEEATAAVEDERNDDDNDDDDDEDDEREARSCWHSSLWKAFHAARWQASLQNLRCRQPLQRSSFWLVARVPQCAHLSMVVKLLDVVRRLISRVSDLLEEVRGGWEAVRVTV